MQNYRKSSPKSPSYWNPCHVNHSWRYNFQQCPSRESIPPYTQLLSYLNTVYGDCWIGVHSLLSFKLNLDIALASRLNSRIPAVDKIQRFQNLIVGRVTEEASFRIVQNLHVLITVETLTSVFRAGCYQPSSLQIPLVNLALFIGSGSFDALTTVRSKQFFTNYSICLASILLLASCVLWPARLNVLHSQSTMLVFVATIAWQYDIREVVYPLRNIA